MPKALQSSKSRRRYKSGTITFYANTEWKQKYWALFMEASLTDPNIKSFYHKSAVSKSSALLRFLVEAYLRARGIVAKKTEGEEEEIEGEEEIEKEEGEVEEEIEKEKETEKEKENV
jgi:hypothetical protein